MAIAVVINLDYENNPREECSKLWEIIKHRMVRQGFRLDGRTFTINLPARSAAARARHAIENIDTDTAFHGNSIYRYLSDFYSYDMACTTNLLMPPLEAIEVRMVNPPA